MKSTSILLSLALILALCSCDNSLKDEPIPVGSGTYVLNNGNWGDNDSSIGIYNPSDKTYASDMFYMANGQRLGDLAQDIICHGDELYIAINGSQTIFVTDRNLKIRRQIDADKDGDRLSPRRFAVCGNDVYVTFYEGYVGKISGDNPVSLCKVGPNPDGIAAAGDKLYVANSGGMAYPAYNNTVSVVSVSSFSEIAVIEVNTNPSGVEVSSDGAYVYVSSYGNYADRPAMLEAVTVSTGEVTALDYASVGAIAKGNDDILYILCSGYDENWNPLPGTIYRHDMKTNRPLGAFVTDGTLLENAYSISATSDGYVYAGCSDYRNTGDIFVFTPSGTLHDTFESAGLNPGWVFRPL